MSAALERAYNLMTVLNAVLLSVLICLLNANAITTQTDEQIHATYFTITIFFLAYGPLLFSCLRAIYIKH